MGVPSASDALLSESLTSWKLAARAGFFGGAFFCTFFPPFFFFGGFSRCTGRPLASHFMTLLASRVA